MALPIPPPSLSNVSPATSAAYGAPVTIYGTSLPRPGGGLGFDDPLVWLAAGGLILFAWSQRRRRGK